MVFDGHPTTTTASIRSHRMDEGHEKPILRLNMAMQYNTRQKGAVNLHFQRKAFRLGAP
jgi:hypothetical protein